MSRERPKTHMEARKDIEARRIQRQLKQTAAERYADHQKDIAALLAAIEQELAVHAEKAAEDPKDWGWPGDLSRVRESMKGILESLLISRHEWSETEASRFIEDYLEDMRGQ